MGIFDRLRGGTVRIHLLIKGQIGDGWQDVDEHVRVPTGTTLGQLLEIADAAQIPLRHALASSPQLTDALMLNGERCPFTANTSRVLAEGDQILLAPPAGS